MPERASGRRRRDVGAQRGRGAVRVGVGGGGGEGGEGRRGGSGVGEPASGPGGLVAVAAGAALGERAAMYGWIHQCAEDLVCGRFGHDAWARTLLEAGFSHVGHGGWIREKYYDDSVIYSLVAGASKALGITQVQVLGAFGTHFVHFAEKAGYGKLMRSMGETLEDFCDGLDRMHRHLAKTMPDIVFPAFWTSRDAVGGEERLLVHYSSLRPALAPMVETILVEVGALYFDTRVSASIVKPQELNEATGEYESTIAVVAEKEETPSESVDKKLFRARSGNAKDGEGTAADANGHGAAGNDILRCPFSGATIQSSSLHEGSATAAEASCPVATKARGGLAPRSPEASSAAQADSASSVLRCDAPEAERGDAQLAAEEVLKTLPYHIMLCDDTMGVKSAGRELKRMYAGLHWRGPPTPMPVAKDFFTVIHLSHTVAHHRVHPPQNEPEEGTLEPDRTQLLTVAEQRSEFVDAVGRSESGVATIELAARTKLPGATHHLRLNGQLSRLSNGDWLFHGVPAVLTVESLLKQGLSLNCLPAYASGLDLLMVGESMFRANEDAKAQFLERDRAATRATNARLATALQYLSHEVRNQLAPVEALVRTLPLDDVGGRAASDRDEIVTSLRTTSDILNSVLAIAKLTAGTIDAPHSVFSLASLVHATDSYAVASVERKGQDVMLESKLVMNTADRGCIEVPVSSSYEETTKVPHLDELYVCSCKSWLMQIIVNLISNATKFTDQGGIFLSWRIDERAPGASRSGNGARDGVGSAAIADPTTSASVATEDSTAAEDTAPLRSDAPARQDGAEAGGEVVSTSTTKAAATIPVGGGVRTSTCECGGSSDGPAKDDDRVLLSLTVTDTGCGIRPEDLSIVMEEFGRVRTGSSSQSGTGLGLPLAKRMIETLGGTLELESEYGVGTSITIAISLPRMQEPDDDDAGRLDVFQGIEQAAIDAMDHPDALDADVLGVDDNSLLLKMYARKALKSGLSFKSASDGDAAVELARQGKRYGIVLMDKQMPELTGDLACSSMRQLGYKGLVALVTADNMSGEEKDKIICEFGLNMVLIKGEAPSWMECLDAWSKGKKEALASKRQTAPHDRSLNRTQPPRPDRRSFRGLCKSHSVAF